MLSFDAKHLLKCAIIETANIRSEMSKTNKNKLSLKINIAEEKFYRHCYNLNFKEIEKYYNKVICLYNDLITKVLFDEDTCLGLVMCYPNFSTQLEPQKEQSTKVFIDQIHETQKTHQKLFNDIMTHKKSKI